MVLQLSSPLLVCRHLDIVIIIVGMNVVVSLDVNSVLIIGVIIIIISIGNVLMISVMLSDDFIANLFTLTGPSGKQLEISGSLGKHLHLQKLESLCLRLDDELVEPGRLQEKGREAPGGSNALRETSGLSESHGKVLVDLEGHGVERLTYIPR